MKIDISVPDDGSGARSPWGRKGVQNKKFSWPAAFGNFQFDTTDAACEVFGVFHNDRVLISRGQWEGKKATVLGVLNGVLWVQLDEEEHVKDLKQCFNEEDLKNRYGLQMLEEEDEDDWPESPTHPKLHFVGARDEEQLKAFEYQGPMGRYVFRCTRNDTEPFGFHHGQRVRATRGACRSRCATVIGVHTGSLWVHLDGDKGATPCTFCNNQHDLERKYGWKVLNTPLTIKNQSIPFNKIEYLGSFGLTYLFDRGEEALKEYGVKHGQKLMIGRGMSAGKHAVVIGVQTGVLWWHIEGDKAATPCTYCSNLQDIQERYAVETTYEQAIVVKPNESVWPDTMTEAEQRRRQHQDIDSTPLNDELWDESQQPQTYRYLRAYARWRLPKNTPPGQAFMLYYVKDTAPRTAEALDNLRTLRKYWAMQRQRGESGYGKPFSQATEKEMLHCLQEIPLSAITILSSA
eukprot:TRINITY_DN3200_c2_g5_i1.p1 TRINITY_DN3200_c2_g5~~TRINITY_DN3200_c2_g5_i1.p1  ORF type:complete len:461 (+),score=99.43 TRINITY_DN3200_c2_g5_i1:55-1437(+)